ncbi:MAG: DUF1178 family protein [Alphaproteobacteria bacterium]|nr:MAG: DUF1178 family protein [Alphaproteobacteria bacterium]
MIVFDLRCAPSGHVFEAWFGSSADYEEQQGRGLVSCPICGSGAVAKAPMAPSVPAKGEATPPCPADVFAGAPEEVKAMLAAAAAVQKKLLKSSECVGHRFADEARAIHLGEAEARPIHGRATFDDAARLIDEGIQVAPLPFPVPDPGEEN